VRYISTPRDPVTPLLSDERQSISYYPLRTVCVTCLTFFGLFMLYIHDLLFSQIQSLSGDIQWTKQASE